MPTTEQVQEIVDKVRKGLAEAEREGVHVQVAGERLRLILGNWNSGDTILWNSNTVEFWGHNTEFE